MNFAAIAALVCIALEAFMSANGQVMRILFLVFNAIFIIVMIIMMILMFADKLDGNSSASLKHYVFHTIVMFGFLFTAVIAEAVVFCSGG